MDVVLQRPTRSEQRMAKRYLDSVSLLADTFKSRRKSVVIEVAEHEDVYLEVSPKVFRLLKDILAIMAKGEAFSLIPAESEISTQQAAEMLNVSRPHLVKLIDSGKIPYRKVGSHRRILLEDILAYMKKLKAVREKSLQELVDQAQEHGMGY